MSDLKTRIKQYEGTKAYQKKLGYFRDGKYYPYLDSLGKPTIGFGHYLIRGEGYPNGISENEAERILDSDIAIAARGLASLGLGDLPDDINDYLIIMIFQLGLVGVKKFVKLLAAARVHDRDGMKKESIESLWYKQTPNRVKDMNKNL